MQISSLEEHRFSGALGLSWIVLPVALAAAAPTFALVHGYGSVYSPFRGVTTVVLAFALAIGLGFLATKVARLSACRSPWFLGVAAFAASVFGWYLSWVAFEHALLGREGAAERPDLLELAARPGLVWEHAMRINANGWFRIFGVQPNGILLGVGWVLEALVIFLVGTFFPLALYDDQIYCERCERWCEERKGVARVALPPWPDLDERIPESTLEELLALAPAGDAKEHLSLDLWACPTCPSTGALKIRSMKITIDEDGDEDEDEDDLTDLLVLSRFERDAVERLAAEHERRGTPVVSRPVGARGAQAGRTGRPDGEPR